MTAQHWTPPDSGVAPSDLPLWNMAMNHMGAPLPLAGTGASLRLSPIGAPHITGPMHELRAADGQRLFLHLDAFPFAQLLGVDFDLEAANDLPPAVADAIYKGSAVFLLQAFPAALTAGMTFEGADTQDGPDMGQLQWFAAALDGLAESPVFFSIGASATDICAFLNGKLHTPNTVLTGLRDRLDVPLHRLIGRAALKLDQVRSLEIGDFIVLEDPATADLILRCEDRIYHFEPAEDGWLCQTVQPFENFRKLHAMDNAPGDPVAPQADEDAALPDMASLVSTMLIFECGTTRMTLSELESLQTGAIVPLPHQLTADGLQVTIRAGAQTIASGEIVQIDDRLAVRVNQLLTQEPGS
ncbi:FliM/FliN family flagellar motor switch protein [Yoonia sp. BS5-3]|uniref:FliM/FliN family flagellar motor switch protein n=1 Tax=Yoonia phaeophyticola TaxID=3137369 RepID=A0ABZ2V9E8_9RHOB